jgi:hypothetical protein
VRDGGFSFSPTVAIEVTPIENWLEIEAGVTPLFSRGARQWGTDLLFKKPYTSSDNVEFMFGAGPEWLHTTSGGKTADSIGGEACSILCFGRGQGESSVGIWSRATDTTSVEGMNNRSA